LAPDWRYFGNGLRRLGQHSPATGREKQFSVHRDLDGTLQPRDVNLLLSDFSGQTLLKLQVVDLESVVFVVENRGREKGYKQ
jgi:hypothetical protein